MYRYFIKKSVGFFKALNRHVYVLFQVPKSDEIRMRHNHPVHIDGESDPEDEEGYTRAQRGLLPEQKAFCNFLMGQGYTSAKRIQERWVEEEAGYQKSRRRQADAAATQREVPKPPTQKHLKSYIHYERNKASLKGTTFGTKVTPMQLKRYAENYSREIVSAIEGFDKHTVYVVGADTFDFSDGGARFVIFWVTDNLIAHVPAGAYTAQMLGLDDTEGTNFQKLPVSIPCFKDSWRVEHPICVCLMSNKDGRAFRTVCQQISTWRPDLVPQVKYICADGADAIFNGAVLVFTSAVWIMCWMHVYIKHVLPLVSKGAGTEPIRKSALNEIRQLVVYAHRARSEAEFDRIAFVFEGTFMCEGADPLVKEKAKSIYDSWMAPTSRRKGFFIGKSLGNGLNNCGLENKHRELKEGSVIGANLGQFEKHTRKFVENQSRVRDPSHPDYKPFHQEVNVTAAMWRTGNEIWQADKLWKQGREASYDNWVIVVNKRDDTSQGAVVWMGAAEFTPNSSCYFTLVSDADSGLTNFFMTEERARASYFEQQDRMKPILSSMLNANWSTTEEIREHFEEYAIVYRVPPGAEGGFFGGYWCACEVCAREFVCEHVVAVRLLLEEVAVPAEYVDFTGRKKRRRGRPRNATQQGVRYGAFAADDDGI